MECLKCGCRGPWGFSHIHAEERARDTFWGQGKDGLVCPICLEDELDTALREFERKEKEEK